MGIEYQAQALPFPTPTPTCGPARKAKPPWLWMED